MNARRAGIGLALIAIVAVASAGASPRANAARADAPPAPSAHRGSAGQAPSGPPLAPDAPGGEGEAVEEDQSAGSARAEADPLVSNGLGSPSCRPGLSSELASAARRNCETSGFLAAPAPTGDYGIDVHIDTGALGLGSGWLLSTLQGLILSPLWMGCVWIVHALIVMLEWSFSVDLLDVGTAAGLRSGLARSQADLTVPWMPLALAVAAVLAAYQGLVRRRIADSLAEVMLTMAMMAAGLWMIADPSGTVGALTGWVNQAGLGTLAVADQGSPSSPGRALGVSMGAVFTATIEAPWCYLEFGDVDWCREPVRLSSDLRAAGLKIAVKELQQAGCGVASGSCSPAGAGAGAGAGAQAMLHSGRLLREARTNGAVFLALAPNGPERNSINEGGSLLHAICQSEDATDCTGPAAAEAEFRTNSGTWPRLGGLLLIVGGLLGMVLLLGYVALRLLMAAVLSLFYLLLTPGVVLAPAFGASGRGLFRAWITRLFGAVVSKLVFAFLLGVALSVMATIGALTALGWWTQWLLMSAFWWGTFLKRNQLLTSAIATGPHRARPARRPVARRLVDAVEAPQRIYRGVRAYRRGPLPPPEVPEIQTSTPGKRTRLSRVRPGTDPPRKPSGDGVSGHSLPSLDRVALGAQLDQIQGGIAGAVLARERRRTARLVDRRERVSREIKSSQIAGHRRLPAGRLLQRSAFLDDQARLSPAGQMDGVGLRRRDYRTLASLLGYHRAEFERLDPQTDAAVRGVIDKELALRLERLDPALAARRKASLAAQAQAQAQAAPRTRPARSRPPTRESELMDDVRAVAEGRKRQLGFGRP